MPAHICLAASDSEGRNWPAVHGRSVTRAAQRLGVTQPAASAALSRLRRHFGDELLVREHGEYVLTPLGEQLAGQVEAVCAAAERLFAASTDFDPLDLAVGRNHGSFTTNGFKPAGSLHLIDLGQLRERLAANVDGAADRDGRDG